jgi:hypothetical protein
MQLFQSAIQPLPTNFMADKIYECLFKKDVFVHNDQAFSVFMNYLNKDAEQEERGKLIELMLKRVLKGCQFSLENPTSLRQATELLDQLADYPNILNHMMKESLAFYHPKVVRNGRELQLNTVMGRILSLSAFHMESQEWKKLFVGN